MRRCVGELRGRTNGLHLPTYSHTHTPTHPHTRTPTYPHTHYPVARRSSHVLNVSHSHARRLRLASPLWRILRPLIRHSSEAPMRFTFDRVTQIAHGRAMQVAVVALLALPVPATLVAQGRGN